MFKIRVVSSTYRARNLVGTSANREFRRELRTKIHDKTGLGFNRMKCAYFFAGKQIEDGQTLDHYGIVQHSTVLFVLRLPGGGCVLPASPGVQFNFVDVDNTGGLKRRQWSISLHLHGELPSMAYALRECARTASVRRMERE